MHTPFTPAHLAPLILFSDQFLRATTRFTLDDPEGLVASVSAGEPAVFVCRHGQLWPVLWAVRGTATEVLVSQSPDGDLLARVLEAWGFGVCRGSSSKAGFSGARGTLRTLREGGSVGLAIDGPRGPRGRVQEGALRLARRAGVPVIPLRAEGSGSWVLRRSWDHFEIPRPLGALRVSAGPRVVVGEGPQGLELARGLIADALDGPDPGGPIAAGAVAGAGR